MKKASLRHHSHRNQRGSMLLLTILSILLFIVCCLAFFAVYLWLAERSVAGRRIDATAMRISTAVNEGDRIGQMNNLIEMNRELCYESRNISNQIDNGDLYFFQPVSDLLLTEARSSNGDLEDARQQQSEIARKVCVAEATQNNASTQTGASLKLPGWLSYPTVSQVLVGYVKGTPSSVAHNDLWTALNDWDGSRSNNYVEKGSGLYSGNINAKLPPPDIDLKFNLCALAPPVGNKVSPARFFNIEEFEPVAIVFDDKRKKVEPITQIPSAVRVTGAVDITAMGLDKKSVEIESTGSCPGAMPPIAGQ